MSPLRTAWALGCSTLALVGCGGGSADTPPPSTLAAPTNFTVELGNLAYFLWSATPGATRYELHVDPDGAGPLPETKMDDYNGVAGSGFRSGFRYTSSDAQHFFGDISGTDVLSLTARLNATYRLRACETNGCGAFTAPEALDIVGGVSHEFASGNAPLKSSGGDFNPRLSKDGLTLVVRAPSAGTDSDVYVFTRGNSAQPWHQQALLHSGKNYFGNQIALSADGSTLAVQASEQSGSDPNYYQGVAYVYQRSGSTWNQQAYLDAPSAPSGCPQPCRADITGHLALSADGSLLATSVSFSTPSGVGNTSIGAVATYRRTGATWAQQAYLETGGQFVSAMALSSDGSTLAVNEGALNPHGSPLTTTTPFVRIFSQQGNGIWSQQARIPAGIFRIVDIAASASSAIALSSDGNTLAVHAVNVPGHQTSELDIQPADLSCGSSVFDGWYIALFARNGSTWQRQAATSRGSNNWALAIDGNALFYGNALFTRNNGAWVCP